MTTDRDNPIRVRLDPQLRERLDDFCHRTRRNLTNAVNLCIEYYLDNIDQPESKDGA